MKRRKLVIISHTEHYQNDQQEIVGWGSTINEVNFLADFWDEVVHVACLYESKAPKSALPYRKSNIRFVSIPPYGGTSIWDKLLIFTKIPIIIHQVVRHVKGASEVQLRLPTSMGVFLLPLFGFLLPRNYTLWVKYAGNWNQENPPLSYRFQRWWLKKNLARCKVTINGSWRNQPSYCLSFENPCLTLEDIEKGRAITQEKYFKGDFVLAFVGRLEDKKGVDKIIEGLTMLPLEKIRKVHFIGDGPKRSIYEQQTSFLKDKVSFHGFLSKNAVHSILGESHFFLLPSESEGFPKAIAEAACYGVLPIVSDVGSISHYINDENGFVWLERGGIDYGKTLQDALFTHAKDLKEKSTQARELAEKFTFVSYLEKLNLLILK